MQGPLVSAWVAMPMAGVTLVVLAAHLSAMHAMEMPASRRRIRGLNGALMMVAAPLLAVAFSVVPPSNARAFALVWLGCIGLLWMILMLALLDMLNTMRLHRRSRRALSAELTALRARAARASRGGGGA